MSETTDTAQAFEDAAAPKPDLRIIRSPDTDCIKIENLTIFKPDGGILLQNVNFTLKPGDRMMLSGASGIGKTALFDTINGDWPYASGSITLPADKSKILYNPQTPYIPLMNLRGIVCYPRASAEYRMEDVEKALREAGLQQFAKDLNNDDIDGKMWAQTFSGGMQQKVVLARTILYNPQFILSDEPTSGMDEASKTEYYAIFTRHFGNCAVIEISHDQNQSAFFNLKAEIKDKTLTIRPIQPKAPFIRDEMAAARAFAPALN